MKITRTFSLIIALAMLVVLVIPAYAQLGDTDVSSITIQNVSGTDGVSVTLKFIDELGTEFQPTQLDSELPPLSNPFTLDDGNSIQVYIPNIPTSQLPSGRYAVVISSTGKVVAVAGVAGTGTTRFSGGYSGFDAGADTTYLGTTAYNFHGWYGMISVMNLGSSDADVTVEISCEDGTTVGTLTKNDIPKMASHTFVLKSEIPSGFTASTVCIGSSKITSDQPIAAVNNQNVPADGRTNTFGSVPAGFSKLYVPQLQNAFVGWNSALNIRKVGAGNTTVTINYDDAEADDTCNLTDTQPSCQLYMPVEHPTTGRFGATITSTALPLLAVVGGTKTTSGVILSGAYIGVGTATGTVAIPNVQKAYFGWNTAITCQNVSATPTTLNVDYEGYPAYDDTTTLNEGDSVQIYVPNETFLPDAYIGGATLKANVVGANIACIVGNSNPSNGATQPGDWTTQFNAFNK